MKVTKANTGRTRRRPDHTRPDQPWRKAFGGLRDLHRENLRIDRLIAEEFERIEPDAHSLPRSKFT
jgi:hypothetical protein